MAITKKKLQDWQKAKDTLAEAKEKEMELRREICSEILGDKLKGTVHLKKFGLDAAAAGKLNTSLDADSLKPIFKKLSPEEKACIKYKPELIAKQYKLLPDDSILHQAVTSKPGTPSLTIKVIAPATMQTPGK